jgi:hypothetical protein
VRERKLRRNKRFGLLVDNHIETFFRIGGARALEILLEVCVQVLLGKRPCLAPLIRALNLDYRSVIGQSNLVEGMKTAGRGEYLPFLLQELCDRFAEYGLQHSEQ